jgi:RNA polymerase sigma factor (sigma-70 family)
LVLARDTPRAFGAFYRRHVHAVHGYFRRRVFEVEAAFDLTAETFAAALRAVPRYEPRPEPARAWLFGIARNTLLEALRRGEVEDRARRALAMQPIVLDEDDVATLELLAETPALEAIDELPDDHREAVIAASWKRLPCGRSLPPWPRRGAGGGGAAPSRWRSCSWAPGRAWRRGLRQHCCPRDRRCRSRGAPRSPGARRAPRFPAP